VEITIVSNLKNLSDLLHRIENHKKFLVVENLVARRVNKTGEESLKTSLLVLGFIRDMDPKDVKNT
jgi:hypothetical protein